jgi:hypothetical protein
MAHSAHLGHLLPPDGQALATTTGYQPPPHRHTVRLPPSTWDPSATLCPSPPLLETGRPLRFPSKTKDINGAPRHHPFLSPHRLSSLPGPYKRSLTSLVHSTPRHQAPPIFSPSHVSSHHHCSSPKLLPSSSHLTSSSHSPEIAKTGPP